MKAEVEFPGTFALLTISLSRGEAIKVEPGALVAMQGIEDPKTGLPSGGVWGGIKRTLTGESFLLNTFKAERTDGVISLSPATPGAIESFDLTGGEKIFVQSGAFLACTENIEASPDFQGLKGLFSGEGLFFLEAKCSNGDGRIFYNSYGAIKRIKLNQGDPELTIDTGHLVAFSTGVKYKVTKLGGLKSALLGGEGLVMRFSGSGDVWIQTHNLSSLAGMLVPFLPSRR